MRNSAGRTIQSATAAAAGGMVMLARPDQGAAAGQEQTKGTGRDEKGRAAT